MRYLISTLFLLNFLISFGQQASFNSWKLEAKKDKRMLPEYGNIEKNAEEKATDAQFITALVEAGKSKSAGAHEMIRIGFDYLYRGDLKTAMYRFNQAYLLNPENSGVYWGYGSVYTALGAYELARKEYTKGLALEPESAAIITDYGTTYLGEYYNLIRSSRKKAVLKLKLAKNKFLEAYVIDPNYINTTYKLSIVYLNSGDCENAKKYLKATRKLGGQPITKEYLADFNTRCGNCSSVKTGTFEIESERNGLTTVKRTDKYQIEENVSLDYKLKLKIDWVDECTYTLTPVSDLSTSKNINIPKSILNCQIIEVNEDHYIQVSYSEENKRQLTSRINIIK